MNDIALAYVTCDKYAFLWGEWYAGFKKYWGVDLPCYFCGEEKPAPFFTQIPHKSVPADLWTAKLREQIKSIPEKYIFVWLDDHIQLMSIDWQFEALMEWAREWKPDALRIMTRESKAHYLHVDNVAGRPVYILKGYSPYRVSFSPNIYERDFLLEVLARDESPWSAEIYGKVGPERSIYAYHIDGWCVNKIRQ